MDVNIRMMAAAAALLLAWHPAATAQSSPYRSDVCPIPAGVRGYTVVVRPEAGTAADSAYLWQVANIVGAFMGEIPRDSMRAAVFATVRADGRLRGASLATPSGNREFDRRVLGGVREAFQSSHLSPPSGFTADSLVVRIVFGEEPAAGEAFRRFSTQWRRPELRTGPGGRVRWPADLPHAMVTGFAVVWVHLDGEGTASVAEHRPLLVSDHRLEVPARQLVPRLAFVPGLSNCEPQTYTEPVRIEFRGGSRVRVQFVSREKR